MMYLGSLFFAELFAMRNLKYVINSYNHAVYFSADPADMEEEVEAEE